MISKDTISDVLRSIDLPEFIGETVALDRRGTSYEGLCPFHDEKSPSFKVFADHYHCFGCGAHGNALEFAMEKHGLSFPEAVKSLAARSGTLIPETNTDWPDIGGKNERNALRYACARYHQMLLEDQGKSAMDELVRRGIDYDTIARFGLGFSPDQWGFLTDDRKFKWDVLISAGLAVPRAEGKKGCYDFFRNRILFPVREPGGDVIGFGGRRLGEEGPKYLNTPDTPVYLKGRVFFGWPQAANAIRRLNTVIVCEGYFDVVIPSQEGIENIISTCGTALTMAQAEFLLAAADNVVFCFDGDAAGAKATWRAAELLLPLVSETHSVSLCRLPAGHDPDSLVREHGIEALSKVIKGAPSLCEYVISEVVRGLRIPEARARAFAKAASLAANINSPVLATFFRQVASQAMEITIEEFNALAVPPAGSGDARACPCCAREAEMTEEENGYRVFCGNCGLSTPAAPDIGSALSRWNRREKPSLGNRYKNEEKENPRVQRRDACAAGAG